MKAPREIGKSLLRSTARALLGPRDYYRLGRFMWLDARGDTANDSRTNGEFQLLEGAMAAATNVPAPVVFDVGGNIGDYSEHVLRSAAAAGVGEQVRLFCFEPNPACVAMIRSRLAFRPNFARSTVVPLAVSDSRGMCSFFVASKTGGTSSLRTDRAVPDVEEIKTETCTLDDFCAREGIARVTLVKIDTEGNDMRAILGAKHLLSEGAIDCLQFEYNWRWVLFRNYLKDVFDFVEPLGYQVGKVIPQGIELLNEWRPELEVFQEGNYVISRNLRNLRLPLHASVIH